MGNCEIFAFNGAKKHIWNHSIHFGRVYAGYSRYNFAASFDPASCKSCKKAFAFVGIVAPNDKAKQTGEIKASHLGEALIRTNSVGEYLGAPVINNHRLTNYKKEEKK